MQTQENIFPVELLKREQKEKLLNQKSKVFWLTGLSGSGKTTIAKAVEIELHEKKLLTQLLDGDNVRTGINNNLGFSQEDREENIRRIAEVSKLFIHCGIITINSFVSPSKQMREMAKSIIGPEDFFEVYINTPLDVCEQRDPKGLYAKARKGEIKNFTGIDAPYEEPIAPALELKTNELEIDELVKTLFDFIISKTTY